MPLSYDQLRSLRKNHPAWALLCARNAPLICAFLERAFIASNVRTIAEADLIEKLEDELFQRRQSTDDYPKSAREYLQDWADAENGWLRRFYNDQSDEAWFDLTPASEKAIAWLNTLIDRQFVGTESRLLTLMELLRQIERGTNDNIDERIADLLEQRRHLDAEIEKLNNGELSLLDDTAIRDRFQQFALLSRELLSDFREVEDNFRKLDREVREQIARWDGNKGELLDEIFGERDAITTTDQGRSFHAFWDFLMSQTRQQELNKLLQIVIDHEAVQSLQPDKRLRHIHYDWLEAGEQTQRTVAVLSRQLRQFLDDKTWVENKRIMQLIGQIENRALDIRDNSPRNVFFTIDETHPSIELPFERPLHKLKPQVTLESDIDEAENLDDTSDSLFDQVWVDRAALTAHARARLREHGQLTLKQLIETRPLEQGLAELVAWLNIADNDFKTTTDPTANDDIVWQTHDADGRIRSRKANLPRIVFVA